MRTLHARRDERALAALITGPLGHLAAGLIDWLALSLTTRRASERRRRRGDDAP